MGYGDYLMALGDAQTLHLRENRRRPVAIGDGRNIDDPYPELRCGLDFIADQTTLDRGLDVAWVHSYRGCRPYHDYAAMRRQWRALHPWRRRWPWPVDERSLVKRLGHFSFNLAYRAVPAPIVLGADEQAIRAEWAQRPFAVIEPYNKAAASPSKRWPLARYEAVAEALRHEIPLYQIGAPDGPSIIGLPRLPTRSFRDAFPYLSAACLYIGPEGGLHHAAAAAKTPAVVIFGGYTPRAVTGYGFHVNLGGDDETACGTQKIICEHCVDAMERITVEEVLAHSRRLLHEPLTTKRSIA